MKKIFIQLLIAMIGLFILYFLLEKIAFSL